GSAAAQNGLESLGPSSRRTGLVISEIMYHPTNRLDGRNLEFIEIYNANALAENIGGYRLSGDVDYSFPSNAIIAANSYLVVAPIPADIQAVYGITAVGGFGNSFGSTNVLPNSGGTI